MINQVTFTLVTVLIIYQVISRLVTVIIFHVTSRLVTALIICNITSRLVTVLKFIYGNGLSEETRLNWRGVLLVNIFS